MAAILEMISFGIGFANEVEVEKIISQNKS